MTSFNDMLQAKWDEGKSVCVGLDPDITRLPFPHLNLSDYALNAIQKSDGVGSRESTASAMMRFNERIIGATYDLVGAYKLNSAFYEGLGWNGIRTLERTIDYIRCVDPTIPVICDAQRGEEADSNIYYAKYAFEILNADAIIVSPLIDNRMLNTLSKYACDGKVIIGRNTQRGGDQSGAALVGSKYSKGQSLILSSSRDVIHASSNANFEAAARAAVVGMQARIDDAVQDVLI